MQYNKEDLTNSMNINYNVYYQNFINVKYLATAPNAFSNNEKLNKSQSQPFYQDLKSEPIGKTFIPEKVKPLLSVNTELPLKNINYYHQSLQDDLKDTPTLNKKQKVSNKVTTAIHESKEEIISHDENITEIIGAILITIAFFSFIGCFYGMFASKWIGMTGNYLLDFIAQDDYYFFLFPLLVPATIIAIYSNWVSMKFFRHS